MSEEVKEEMVEQSAEKASAEPSAKKKKWPIVVGIVAVVLVAAGAGFWVWHEQPSFCNAICHTPMDVYVETYDAPANAATTDKWGNEVSNSMAMLAVSHRENGVNCLGCHVPTLQQQLHEVQLEITGDYYYPLEEKGIKELVADAGGSGNGDSFCLKSGCHSYSRAELTEKTSGMKFNPHRWQHGETECSECHKSHRASVFYCTQCHAEAKESMPDGWVDYQTGKKLATTALEG